MYKDAGVMGGKIKSTLTTNPMMTSPAGLNPTTGMGMFQPAFQPGNIKRDFKKSHVCFFHSVTKILKSIIDYKPL